MKCARCPTEASLLRNNLCDQCYVIEYMEMLRAENEERRKRAKDHDNQVEDAKQ